MNPEPQGEGICGRTWKADRSGGRLSPENAPPLPAVWKREEEVLRRPHLLRPPGQCLASIGVSKLPSLWHLFVTTRADGDSLGC